VTDARFQKNIISSSASYDTKESQVQRYDVKGMTRLVLNTGFVNEDFNQTIEELLLSEDTWITYEGNVLAAIPTTKQLQYATSVNNKTINYTVQFDFASETINSVR
jgi:hypothetical protein